MKIIFNRRKCKGYMDIKTLFSSLFWINNHYKENRSFPGFKFVCTLLYIYTKFELFSTKCVIAVRLIFTINKRMVLKRKLSFWRHNRFIWYCLSFNNRITKGNRCNENNFQYNRDDCLKSKEKHVLHPPFVIYQFLFYIYLLIQFLRFCF